MASAEFVRLASEALLASPPTLFPHRLHVGSFGLEAFGDTVVWDGTDLCPYDPAVIAAARLWVVHCFAGVEAGAELQTALLLCFLLAAYLIRKGVAWAARSDVIVREIRTAVAIRRA